MTQPSTFTNPTEPGHPRPGTRQATATRAMATLLVFLAVTLLAGCGGGSGTGTAGTGSPVAGTPPPTSSTAGNLVSVRRGETLTEAQIAVGYQNKMVKTLGNDAAATVQGQAVHVRFLRALAEHAQDSVETDYVSYETRDAKSQKITVSGKVFFPLPKLSNGPISVPIVLYPHGTELKRDQVPSNSAGAEAFVGCAAALAASVVVAMPDLPGMGHADPQAYHPYCHADSLAYSVADMLTAARQAIEERGDHYTWNGDVYVVGYSEGGYAAMAAVRELETHRERYGTFNLRGEACMAAPCSLSTAMRQMMLDKTHEFPAPFFLPYIIYGYSAVYPSSVFDPSLAMNKVLLQKGADGDIGEWMNGRITGEGANKKIEARMGVGPGKVIPVNLMDPTWVSTQLADPAFATSAVGQILRANDLDTGWAPTASKMLILHAYDDDCVPFDNSQRAYDNFVQRGAKERVRFIPIGEKGDKMTHVQAALVALPSAFLWIKTGMPMD